MNDSHWYWLVGGLLLLSAEMLVPGVYLVWIGGAALLTGLFALGLPFPAELAAFAALSVGGVLGGRRWYREHPVTTSDPLLNDRAARLVGEIVTVVEAVDSGRGRVRVGDGMWSARGPAAAEGARVLVIGSEGQLLIVAPLPRPEDPTPSRTPR